MKRILLSALLLLCVCIITHAQDQPNQGKFPTALDSSVSLIEAKDFARTQLQQSINASATSITVASTQSFPNSGLLVINGVEIVSYTGKTSTTFTGLLRGREGTAAISHASGVSVEMRVLSAYHNRLSLTAQAMQAKIGFGATTPDTDKILIGTALGASNWLDHTLDRIKDVIITTPVNGHTLSYLNGNWINQAPAVGAPDTLSFITTQAEGALSNEKVLGADVIMRGTLASRPAASIAGRLYWVTDSGLQRWTRDNGSSWDDAALHWNQVVGKPSTFDPSDHATEHHSGGGDPLALGSIAGSLSSSQHGDLSGVDTSSPRHHWNQITNKPSTFAPSAHGAAAHTGNVFPGANQDLGAFYVDVGGISAPSNPAAGTRRLFVDSSTGKISVRTSSGVTVSLEEAGVGSGDNITINGSASSDGNFSNSTPAAPTNGFNVRWQKDTSAPDNLSGHLLTTDIGSTTFGSGSAINWTFNSGSTNPVVGFGDGFVNVSTGELREGGTRVVVQSRAVNTSSPLGGGGDLSSDLTLTCVTCLTGSSPANNGVLLGQGTQGVGVAAAGSANQVFRVGGGGGAPAFGSIDLSQSATVGSSILGGANGGTGSAFFRVLGLSGSLKDFTFPNASATVLTTNALVTVPQGGIGVGTLTGIAKGNGTSPFTAATPGTDYFAPGAISFSVETAGNDITTVTPVIMIAAGCNGTAAFPGFDIPTSDGGVANCYGTSPHRFGGLDFADGTARTATAQFKLPPDHTGAIDVEYVWFSGSTSTNSVVWTLRSACVANNEDLANPTYNSEQTVADANHSTANRENVAVINSITTTGCAPGETLFLRVGRNPANGSDTLAATATLMQLNLILRRQQ